MTATQDKLSRLVLIRHGQSVSNLELWISSQSTCGGLTDLGRAEAATARDRLATMSDLAPDAIVVSTMKRALETADIVAQPTGMTPEARAELIEREPGEAQGLTVPEYTEKYGRAPWMEWEAAMSPGGEDSLTFQTRVATAIDRLRGETVGRTTWVVCHGWVITATAHHLAGGTAGVQPPFGGVANAAICVWASAGANQPWFMERFNDHSHTMDLAPGTGSLL